MTVSVREQSVPDQQIARLPRNRLYLESLQIGMARIPVCGLRLYPLIENIMETGNTLEASLILHRIRQIKNALHAKRDRVL